MRGSSARASGYRHAAGVGRAVGPQQPDRPYRRRSHGPPGQPVLQIREGPGLKLQWRGSCVLDAYLYLQGNVERITQVDTRLANGNDTPQPACIASLARP